jgi:plastocyanin
MTAMRTRMVLVFCGAVVMLAGCGDNKVGSGNMFSSLQPQGSGGLGSESPSAAPASMAPTAMAIGQAPPPQKTAPPHTAAPATVPPVAATARPQAFVIGIYADTNPQGYSTFNPPSASVYTGTAITWVNHDSVARSVLFDAGDPAAYNSGPIPPGGSASFIPTAPGQYAYHDGTRPYAIAQFSAASR